MTHHQPAPQAPSPSPSSSVFLLQSMTGFGHAAVETARLRVAVTVRSVNHRFLDLALRLRDDQRPLEPELRERLDQRLARGRVEVSLDVEPLGAAPAEVEVNRPLAVALKEASDALVADGLLAHGPVFGDLMRIPDIVRLRPRTIVWEGEERDALWAALDQALDELIAARGTEGGKLAAILEEHVAALERLIGEMREAAASWPQIVAANLEKRVEALIGDGSGPEPDRLALEVALIADKSDVCEELDRLGSHFDHFRTLMAETKAVGKRLDFLAQEIFRELNTVGSKCRNATLTRLVLEAKSRCEQIREQVQNVE